MNVLVIAAHPDDEVLGCGGTMAKLTSQGHAVHVSILGEGLTSRSEQRDDVPDDRLQQLAQHSRDAGDVLGVQSVEHHGLPDNRFDSVDLLDVIKIIESRIRDVEPERIYTQHGGDLNIDHAITFRATLTATRPVAGAAVQQVLAYEVASSSEWAFGQFDPPFVANVFEDITKTLELKLRAMACYATESREPPHPRSETMLRAAAQRWGGVAGCDAAEAFSLLRAVNR